MQIMDAATQLVSERGYWGVSIADVGQLCGITDAGVLHHFGTKANLLLAVVEHRDEADRIAVSAQLGVPREDLYEALRDTELRLLCEAFVTRNASQPEIVRLYTVLNAESLAPSHPAHRYFVERERLAIQSFATARSGDDSDPWERGRLALAAMDGLQLRWLRAPDEMDLLAAWREVFSRLFPLG